MISPSLLVENATVFTAGKTPEVLPHHSVLIENGFISSLAPKDRFRRFKGARLDGTGQVAMPGLINAHSHFYSTFARGLIKTLPAKDFLGVLENLWWRLDSALTLEDCYYGALIALLDSIRHGTTTTLDHHASPRAVTGSLTVIARAVKEAGLRACLCYELSDRDGARIARQGMEENAGFIRHCQEQNDPQLAALFGLHASFTLSDVTLAAASQLGLQLKTGFHLHVAEALSDQQASLRNSGLRVVQRLNQFDLLGPQTIAAHCVHVHPREMELLAETQTTVVHNPQSNLNNGVGIADLMQLNRRGVLVGLGTDAMTTHMLEELRAGLWAQHHRNAAPSAGLAEVTSALLVNNAEIARRIFGLPLGELREGCVGDLILLDYDPPTPMENSNALGHLVFGLSQAAVDTTIVGGKVLLRNKQLQLNLDEARLNARARELARSLWKRL